MTSTSTADPAGGYVAAAFGRYDNGNDGFALAFKKEGSDKEFVMPINPDSRHRKSHEPQVLVMKLPPGTYSVTEWITYAMGGREQTRGPVRSVALGGQFVVDAGRINFLGSFDLLKQYLTLSPVMTVRWAIEASPIHEAEARSGINEGYPGLTALRLNCTGCSK